MKIVKVSKKVILVHEHSSCADHNNCPCLDVECRHCVWQTGSLCSQATRCTSKVFGYEDS